MLRPVQPGRVKNSLLNVLDRHGIAHDTAQSIWDDLTTGNDPLPNGLPASFIFKGIEVAWPTGRHTRLLREDERKALNNALKHSTTANKRELLDSEDSAELARHAYTCLYNLTTQIEYDSTPIAVTAMAKLVEKATKPTQITVEHVAALVSQVVDVPTPITVVHDAFSRDLVGNVEPWAIVHTPPAPTTSRKKVEHVSVLDDLSAQLAALQAAVDAR